MGSKVNLSSEIKSHFAHQILFEPVSIANR